MADEGIEVRHEKSCRSLGRRRGRCNCDPTYRASVWSAREGKRVRKLLPDARRRQGLAPGRRPAPSAAASCEPPPRRSSTTRSRSCSRRWTRAPSARGDAGHSSQPPAARPSRPTGSASPTATAACGSTSSTTWSCRSSSTSSTPRARTRARSRARSSHCGWSSAGPAPAASSASTRPTAWNCPRSPPASASRHLRRTRPASSPRSRTTTAPIWATAMLAGTRRGELLALDWPNVDFKTRRPSRQAQL